MSNSTRTSILWSASLGSLLIGVPLMLLPVLQQYLGLSIAVVLTAGFVGVAVLCSYLIFKNFQSGKLKTGLGQGTFLGICMIVIGLSTLDFNLIPLALRLIPFFLAALFAFSSEVSIWLEMRAQKEDALLRSGDMAP